MRDQPICIYLAEETDDSRKLVELFQLQVRALSDAPDDWHLTMRDAGLVLAHPAQAVFQLHTQRVTRRSRGREPTELHRACDVRPGITILDGLGGWGVDGLSLALAGASVTLCESHPLVYVLQAELSRRLYFPAKHVYCDVLSFLSQPELDFDVIYLDPMFPSHPKNAKPNRDLAILEQLANPTLIEPIFSAAMAVANERVVIKQRLHAALTDLPDPQWSIKGRSIRFDVFSTLKR